MTPKEQHELITKIGEKIKLDNVSIFVRFIQTRFPDEQYEGYIREWAERFKGGNPIMHMDETSKSIYLNIIQN